MDRNELIQALERTCELLASSEEAMWADATPEELREDLGGTVTALRGGRRWRSSTGIRSR